jgi:hypothetical protein
MDKFVEDMLKSAEKKGKAQAYKGTADPSEIAKITENIQAKVRKVK